MKTKILLFFTAVLTVSFMSKPNVQNPDSTSEIVCLNNEEVENLNLDDDVIPFQLGIRWINHAVYQGSMNWNQIRINTRTHYENESGKSPNHIVIDNNKEVWFFDGTVSKAAVEEEISKDGTIETDDGD